jgi:PleD family two-component response regulator
VRAEYDIAELERINDAILEVSKASTLGQNDVTRKNVEIKEREAEILEESMTDILTGVGNRRKLELALVAEISRVRREGGALSAIMGDIDHFKRVNDEYGHAAGDKVLARFLVLLECCPARMRNPSPGGSTRRSTGRKTAGAIA